jgi:hypothetical protein
LNLFEAIPAFRTRYFLFLAAAAKPPQPKIENELKQLLQSGLGYNQYL